MQLIQSPEPFSPAFGEVLYAVSLSENEVGAEVSIFNSAVTEKIGIKKAPQAPEFTLNVADYLRAQVRIRPFPMQPCGVIDAGERTFFSCVAHGDWSASQPHTAGIVPVATNEPMCGPGTRSLARGEQDEIAWVAGAGSVFARALFTDGGKDPVEIHLGRAEIAEPCMLALIVNSDHLARQLEQHGRTWDEQHRFTMELHFDYQRVTALDYRIRPHNPRKTRLAWWNRRGGIDLHSFESTQESRTFERPGSRAEKILRTACTTRQQAFRLSEIPGAPKAWTVDGDRIRPVKVAFEKSFPIDGTQETVIEIRIADTETTPFQTL